MLCERLLSLQCICMDYVCFQVRERATQHLSVERPERLQEGAAVSDRPERAVARILELVSVGTERVDEAHVLELLFHASAAGRTRLFS